MPKYGGYEEILRFFGSSSLAVHPLTPISVGETFVFQPPVPESAGSSGVDGVDPILEACAAADRKVAHAQCGQSNSSRGAAREQAAEDNESGENGFREGRGVGERHVLSIICPIMLLLIYHAGALVALLVASPPSRLVT